MGRFARVVIAEVAQHVTQRGNGRQFLLATDSERMVYLDLLRQAVHLHAVSVIGYCLMSNHVHMVLIPHQSESLALALKATHGRYAAYWNAAHTISGHAWQGRFYSCPMDEGHLWQALRYTELNPVRAGMVDNAAAWAWSSAAAHCGTAAPDDTLAMEMWNRRWTAATWRQYLEEGESESELKALRRSTYTGRPLGSVEFIARLEQVTHRRLSAQKGGRPRNTTAFEIPKAVTLAR
jgi:putative transposase